jgi:acetolactate synthase-1/2/3 large subunit
LADNRAYASELFVHGDAALSLNALADALEGRLQVDPHYAADVQRVRRQAEAAVDATLGPYVQLKNALAQAVGRRLWWVRDITLSNTMWGNRAPVLDHPRAGVHALGGGIGQGLAMGIGTAVADAVHGLGRKTVVLAGDGGFMLNVGELACAAQERADLLVVLMNDSRYGVIRNIQDAVYGSRHCYVDLHNPRFDVFCDSLGVQHLRLDQPERALELLTQALKMPGPVVLEVDMDAWGPFAVKFAGPPKKPEVQP